MNSTIIRPPSEPPRGLEPGTVLLDRFEIRQLLGIGGMGAVYKGVDLEALRLNDPHAEIALKVLSPAIQEMPDAVLALQREVSRARRLAHRNIIRMYEFYRTEDACFITMELLDGVSWEDFFRTSPHGISINDARPLITQLCSALEYGHAEGVVHSDLKPANLFLTRDQTVKVLDYGIAARLPGISDSQLETRFNPRHMNALSESHAPIEVWHGLDADPRDDVYSCASVIYELLAGRRPYEGNTAPAALERGLKMGKIKQLSHKQNEALGHALALSRKDRTASISAFEREFWAAHGSRWPKLTPLIATVLILMSVLIIGFLKSRSPSRATVAELSVVPSAVMGSAAPSNPSLAPVTHDEVANKCSSTPGDRDSATLLTSTVDRALKAQVQVTLAADENDKRDASAALRQATSCLAALADVGITSVEAKHLLQESEGP